MANTSFIGEVLHTNAVRLRITGVGNLLLFLRSLNAINNQQLASLVMLNSTNIEPTTLANFIDQRVQLEVRTIGLDEILNVSKIIMFVRPIASGYPQ